MGVLGLGPFIQKICPEVIKKLPERFKAFNGKTIVIDGTLVTQRLHFVAHPHPFRHVIGWYRLIRELQDCNVKAICVFDGKERNIAKAMENERRQHVRRQDTARGMLENERLERVQKMSTLVSKLSDLQEEERERAEDVLRTITSDVQRITELPALISEESAEEETLTRSSAIEHQWATRLEGYHHELHDIDFRKISQTCGLERVHVSQDVAGHPFGTTLEASTDGLHHRGPSHHLHDRIQTVDDIDEDLTSLVDAVASVRISDFDDFASEIPDDVFERMGYPPTHAHEITYSQDPTFDDTASLDSKLRREAGTIVVEKAASKPEPEAAISDEPAAETSTISVQEMHDLLDTPEELSKALSASRDGVVEEDIPAALANLWQQFQRSMSQLTSLPEPLPVPVQSYSPADSDADPADAAADARTEYVMSKTQHQLTLEEGAIWERLAESVSAGDGEAEVVRAHLAALEEKSTLMSESYRRRTNPPTVETYEQCKEIIDAMGVPCIVTDGPYEAEALASALVLQGLGDYVASEDTDVLVYEAPLLRNLTNRRGPLHVISGAELRAGLQLDRAGFVDFALLLGTDFSQRIKHVGPARALRFIRAHGTIERVLAAEPRYPPRMPTGEYLAQVALARSVFATLPPVPRKKLLRHGVYDERRVARILEKYHLQRLAAEDVDYSETLSGNYF
ncbi:hypothetical protein CERSUDRAFT_116277 [Gelatoporia subvermispora B]|uniref:PIN domain-like protein n=1 Tax=Ceriporiopsis subvermispora (strain B) TaxID=914234 RepID=M2RAU3_CERS8|nr:hypothetical protein CERSUDRAFT_116277 [Gelatoporia subvermispora B]